jgi:hypothetical protein
VLAYAKKAGAEKVYDDVLVPALTYLKRDREGLTDQDEKSILETTQEVIADLGERQAAVPSETAEPTLAPATVLPVAHILGFPARDEADRLALEMLRQLLQPGRWEMEVPSVDMLTAELVSLTGEKEPAAICIGSLAPGGLAHTRYLCKRLRSRFPKVKIIVGRWGLTSNVEQNQEQLREAGASQIATTLLETQQQLCAWLPVLAQEQPAPLVDVSTRKPPKAS